ncbi:ABC transporter ATP-binding protein [Candidatus Frankia nodulisporulans]|uniref:ABC transporter ATP-binding protein n=1 Tax=Candidatus Frankia nodulisporulans TaxID=2060052 RepID=UPI001582B890|nr:ABC transporter ATP-binding protein [Candidatus Frankia nodulisporulans]
MTTPARSIPAQTPPERPSPPNPGSEPGPSPVLEPGPGSARADLLTTTLRRLRGLTPELTRGLLGTLVLALVATAGKVAIPVTVQQILDRGLADDQVDLTVIGVAVGVAAVVILTTALANYRMNRRLYRLSETTLATLRVRAFRHIHDLSVLSQSAQRRGSLTSRVTSDIDQMSQFLQFGGVMLLVSTGQMLIATVLMVVYSWQLTLLVYGFYLPLFLITRRTQRRLAGRYAQVRERIGELLGAVAEAVVGASVVRAYGVQERTAQRIDTSIDRHRGAQSAAQKMIAGVFSLSELVAALATAAAVIVGVLLGVDGALSTGRLVAFLFLMTLFIMPIQSMTEILNDAANALAGLRRVLDVLDLPTDVRDPALTDGSAPHPVGAPHPAEATIMIPAGSPPSSARPGGRELPAGPLGVRFTGVGFAYPDGPPVLRDIDLEIAAGSRIAVVGETGSGKTTLVKLLTRLMDPSSGEVLIGGVPLAQVRFASLRRRVLLVPQEGFLFDLTIADNVRYGRPGADDAAVHAAFEALGLGDWLATHPEGLATRVGESGSRLSAGERQLVALARARLADPDLLVLDEATSAVDPETEVRLAQALAELMRERTSVTIAHRLSTAETADEVLVVDAGRIAQRGRHRDLVAVPGIYQRLHQSWVAGVGSTGPAPARPHPPAPASTAPDEPRPAFLAPRTPAPRPGRGGAE